MLVFLTLERANVEKAWNGIATGGRMDRNGSFTKDLKNFRKLVHIVSTYVTITCSPCLRSICAYSLLPLRHRAILYYTTSCLHWESSLEMQIVDLRTRRTERPESNRKRILAIVVPDSFWNHKLHLRPKVADVISELTPPDEELAAVAAFIVSGIIVHNDG